MIRRSYLVGRISSIVDRLPAGRQVCSISYARHTICDMRDTIYEFNLPLTTDFVYNILNQNNATRDEPQIFRALALGAGYLLRFQLAIKRS